MEVESRKMDTGGTRLALAIVILWTALLFFFIALHPNGILNVTNPVEALQWLINEFQGGSSEAAGFSSASSSGVSAAVGAVTSGDLGGQGPQDVGSSPAETGA
jgi:hypothetical protein